MFSISQKLQKLEADLAQCRSELTFVTRERDQLSAMLDKMLTSNMELTRQLYHPNAKAQGHVSHLFGKPMDEICDIIDRDARTQNAIKGFVDLIDLFHKETK